MTSLSTDGKGKAPYIDGDAVLRRAKHVTGSALLCIEAFLHRQEGQGGCKNPSKVHYPNHVRGIRRSDCWYGG